MGRLRLVFLKKCSMKKSTFTLLLAALFIMQGLAQQVTQEQRLVLTKRTASWCTFCGTWGWNLFQGLLEDNEGRAVLIAAHYDGILATAAGKDITDNFGSFSQPRFFVNEVDINATSGSVATVRSNIKSQVDAAFATLPDVNTGFVPVYSDGEIKVQAKVKFFNAVEGEYFLGIYLLEDNVIAFQQSIGSNANHKKVFRESFTSSTWGLPVVNGSVEAGAEFDLDFALPIGGVQGYDYEVVGIIWKKTGSKYAPVNAWSTTQFGTVSDVDDAVAAQQFTVAPSIASSSTTIRLELPHILQDVSVDVFDLNGKLVANLVRGPLGQGTHRFELGREILPGNGVYLVRLRNGQEVATSKVVFQ